MRSLLILLALVVPSPTWAEDLPDVTKVCSTWREFGRGVMTSRQIPMTIEETLAPLWPHIQRAMNAVMAVDEIRTRAWREHAEIVRLVRAGDAEGAASAAWSHAANAGSETEQRLRQAQPA